MRKKEEYSEDKTLVESIVDTLSVPGSTVRSVAIESMKAYKGDEDFNYESVLDNMLKKDYTGPDEFLTEIESTFGVPKKIASGIFGSAVGLGVGAKVGALAPVPGGVLYGAGVGAIMGGALGGFTDIGANFLTDVATDPINYIFGGVSKLRGIESGRKLAVKSRMAQRALRTGFDVAEDAPKIFKELAKGSETLVQEGKISKAMLNETASKSLKLLMNSPDDIARAVTGFTLGAMSIDHNDDAGDIALKLGGLTLAGPSAIRVVDKAGFKLNAIAEDRLNKYYLGKHQELFKQIEETYRPQFAKRGRAKGLSGDNLDTYVNAEMEAIMNPSNVFKIARNASQSLDFKKNFSDFLSKEAAITNEATKIFKEEAKELFKNGELKNIGDIDTFTNQRLDEFFYKRGDLFSKQVRERQASYVNWLRESVLKNTIERRQLKGLQPEEIKLSNGKSVKIDEEFINYPEIHYRADIEDLVKEGKLGTKQEIEDYLFQKVQTDLEKLVPRSDRDNFNLYATLESNEYIRKWIGKNLDPKMKQALAKVKDSNFKNIQEYNKYMKEIDPNHFPIAQFDYWTYDLNKATSLSDKLSVSPDDLVRRVRTNIVSHIDGLDRNVVNMRAASEWAGFFLSDKEKAARRIITAISEGKDSSTSLKRMIQNIQMARSPKLFEKLKSADDTRKSYRYVDMLKDNGEIMMNIHDQWLSLIKGVHLTTNSTWAKNNLFDNTVNAYLLGGSKAGTAALLNGTLGPVAVAVDKLGQATGLKVLQDMVKRNAFNRIYNSITPVKNASDIRKYIDYGDDAINISSSYGVVDDTMFTDYRNMALRGENNLVNFIAGEKGAEKIAQQLSDEGWISKFAKWTDDKLWNGIVGRYNSTIEATMRHVAFMENAKSIAKVKYGDDIADIIDGTKKGMAERRKFLMKFTDERRYLKEGQGLTGLTKQKAIKDYEQARDLRRAFAESKRNVDKIFFDYGKVTEFEREVMKKIFPYWTFWTRNFKKFTDIMFDPRYVGKIGQSSKAFTSSGRPLTDEERGSIPSYYVDKGARVINKRKGDIEVLTAPSMALFEFANNFKLEDIPSRLSPIIKATPVIGETGLLNMDYLTKQQLIPDKDMPKVRLFENTATMLPDSILKEFGIYRNANGTLYTNSEKAARLLHMQKNVLPLPGITDQLSRSMRNVQYRASNTTQEIKEFLSPFRRSVVTKEQAQYEGKKSKKSAQKRKSDDPAVILYGQKPLRSKAAQKRRERSLERQAKRRQKILKRRLKKLRGEK